MIVAGLVMANRSDTSGLSSGPGLLASPTRVAIYGLKLVGRKYLVAFRSRPGKHSYTDTTCVRAPRIAVFATKIPVIQNRLTLTKWREANTLYLSCEVLKDLWFGLH